MLLYLHNHPHKFPAYKQDHADVRIPLNQDREKTLTLEEMRNMRAEIDRVK